LKQTEQKLQDGTKKSELAAKKT